jgi:hypothetical protein
MRVRTCLGGLVATMTVAAVVGAADTPHVGARLVSDTASL